MFEGSMGIGQVYRAIDIKLGRDVALKVLPPEWADDPERLERFPREAKALAALDQPNIVTVHSVEEADGAHHDKGIMHREPPEQNSGRALDHRTGSFRLGIALYEMACGRRAYVSTRFR